MTARPRRKAIPVRVKLAAAAIAAGIPPENAIRFANDVDWKNDEIRLVAVHGFLLMIGLRWETTQWDHDPALGLRPLNEDGTDTVPPQLDPRHIVPRSTVDHRTKTSGTPPGQKVVHVANGDTHKIGKTKRLEADRLERADRMAFERGMTEPDPRATTNLHGDARVFAIGYSGTAPEGGVIAEARAHGIPAPKPSKPWPQGRKMQSRGFEKRRGKDT